MVADKVMKFKLINQLGTNYYWTKFELNFNRYIAYRIEDLECISGYQFLKQDLDWIKNNKRLETSNWKLIRVNEDEWEWMKIK